MKTIALTTTNPVRKRGFGSMSPERQREIASKGGKAVPASKRSFSTNKELASAAGRKGGKAVPAHKRTFNDQALASAAGRKGGLAVSAEKRSFSLDRELASRAGRKGGSSDDA